MAKRILTAVIWLPIVALGFAFAPIWGIAMVWYAVPIGWFLNWLISYRQYRTGKWRSIYQKGDSQ